MKKRVLIGCTTVLLVSVVGLGILLRLYFRRVPGQEFDSNSVRIHYTDEGAGEPVILVHGFAVNGDLNWRKPHVVDALSKDFRVITMDLRGHGLSGKPHDPGQYGMEMVKDVVRLMDHLYLSKAHVVGYSLGGAVTLKLAATFPDRLLTASPLGSGWEKTDNSAFLAALARLAEALDEGKGITPVSGALGGDREKPGRMHTAWVWLMTKYFNDRQALVGVLKGIPELALTEDEVRGIPVPVCSIVGERDPLKVGVDNMKGIVRDHTVTVIPGADHLRTPMRKEFVEALRAFLLAHRAVRT
jgi:pimeloyl-ACP methyl ester carboxylesterase